MLWQSGARARASVEGAGSAPAEFAHSASVATAAYLMPFIIIC